MTTPTPSERARYFFGIWMLLSALTCLVAHSAAAELDSVPLPAPEELGRPLLPARDWYYFVAAVNVYPALESENLVDQLLEPLLRTLSPGHDGVHTISDLRDEHLLWPPHLGLGKNLNDKWSIFLEAGYTAGKVRTKNDRASIFLLPLHTDFEIKRSALFAGVGLDYFPWGMTEQRTYDGLADRLAGIRPFLGTRLTWTYATYRAKVKLGLNPFPSLVNLELHDAWALPSATIVGGIDVPLSRDTSLTMNAGYNHFWDQAFDFEGFAFTVQWRHYFNGPRFRGLREVP
jgi:hypothetical protein